MRQFLGIVISLNLFLGIPNLCLGSIEIHGKVVDKETGELLSGATVKIESDECTAYTEDNNSPRWHLSPYSGYSRAAGKLRSV